MRYQFPVRIPQGWNLTVSQPFASTEMADFYAAHGIKMVAHDGVDVVCGTPEQTWGTACVWPFPWPGTVYYAEVDSPVGAMQHAHSQIDTVDPDTGISYSLIFLHVSAVVPQKVFNQGETTCYIGNNGAVSPVPTPQAPFKGSHLHLGFAVKHPQELNFTMVDPLIYLDINNPFRGPDDPSRDQAVYDWAKEHGATPAPEPKPQQFTKDLYFGMIDPDVQRLQVWLNTHGYPVAPAGEAGSAGHETTYFGTATRAAVIAYQTAKGIKPNVGYVGALTRKSING